MHRAAPATGGAVSATALSCILFLSPGFLAGYAVAQPGPINAARAMALHVQNRMTFGPTPLLTQRLANVATIEAWIKTQINLTGSENSAIGGLLTQFPAAPTDLDTHNGWTRTKLLQHQLVYGTFTDKYALRELMTWFWMTHFNSDVHRVFQQMQNVFSQGHGGAPSSPSRERGAMYAKYHDLDNCRRNGLGYFTDLLLQNYRGPAMRCYLNLIHSRGRHPNEDYARELLELHTMGPENLQQQPNYSQGDVQGVARVLSGQRVHATTGAPFAFADHHTGHPNGYGGNIQLFGGSYTVIDRGNSTSNIQQNPTPLIIHLSGRLETKIFVSQKLMRFFLGDEVNDLPLLRKCVRAWGTRGDIKAVLTQILLSPQFLGTTYRWKRLKTPIETMSGVVRSLAGTVSQPSDVDRLLTTIRDMGQVLHEFKSPDGYPLISDEQTGSSVYLTKVQYAIDITDRPNLIKVRYDLRSLARAALTNVQFNSANGITRYYLDLLYHGRWSTLDHRGAIEVINARTTTSNVVWPPATVAEQKERIKRLVTHLLSLPQGWEK